MRLRMLVAGAVALMLAVSAAPAQDAKSPLTPEQEQRIRELVKEYILANPELILEAVQTLRRKQEEMAGKAAREALRTHREALLTSKDLPVAGNPQGTVTIVEFFDYRCGYCKGVKPTVEEVLKSDGKIRLVLKEFPILGPASRTASLAAVAAHKQGKYFALHNAMMGFANNLTDDVVFALAKQVGLDLAKLKQDMNDVAVKDVIESTHKVAEELGIRGTPAFIIGDEIIPGAIPAEEFKQRIAAARAACKQEKASVC